MRKAILAALLGSALVLAVSAPAFATVGTQNAQLTVVCSCSNSSASGDLLGTYLKAYGATGPVVLTLWASSDGKTWVSTGKTTTINLVLGQKFYGFKFSNALNTTLWMDFKVSGGGAISRVLSRDECGFRVPEAPATPLLLIGALPAFGFVGLKAAGIRLPLPTRNRIA
jgi:hypothetical protein